MDWWDLAVKLLPAVTALIGSFAGAWIGPLIARKTSLETARLNLLGQRSLAQEAAARAEQATERQERHDLLEPLLTLAREHLRDVQTSAYAGTPEPPPLREDVRSSAVPSTRFQTAMGLYRHAKASVSLALLSESDKRDVFGLPSQALTDPLRRLTTTVLDLHDAAQAYIREGRPDSPQA